MSNEATYTWKETTGKLAVLDTKPNHNITFHNQDNKQVGALDFNGPEMVFTGDADESAKVFFDWIARSFKERLEQERADEREACAKVCDDLYRVWTLQEDEIDPPDALDCKRVIRARSNT